MNALALVIGNADYLQQKDKLNNAVNDANDFGNKLVNLGFIVNKRTDCNVESFDRAVQTFGQELKKFDIGLFYFSGHGLQIKGKNYLTGIDTSFADDISAMHSSIPLDEIIDYMQAANPIIKILILDACRDNPLPSQFRGLSLDGLAPIYAPKGTMIAFSTSPGEKAMDYGAGRNSIYTGSLLNHIEDVNIPIEDFFKRVRTSVYTLSNGKQTSWEHTSLIGNFCFNSGQLIQSIDLPYEKEHIADECFESDGSDIDEIIKNLKSYNWPKQQSAIKRLRSINKKLINESTRFLLGRNILQTGIGGEYNTLSIIKNLDEWLKNWFTGEENHVLNGILYEIYFNSKGQFRQKKFKAELINEVFVLENIERYKVSFDFIQNQLKPFHEYLFYIPSYQPATLPIELKFDEEKIKFIENEISSHRLVSIRMHDVEIMESDTDSINVLYDEFINRLHLELCVPIKRLRLSMNVKEVELKHVIIPWEMKVSKIKK